MKDATVYHNHLGSTSFSFEDVELIVANEAKAFIVCSPQFDYIVRRPTGGWNFIIEVQNEGVVLDLDSASIFEECLTVADQQLSVDVAQGQFNDSEKEDVRMHYIWATFFNLKDIYYKRTPNP
ncbi:MAG: hypothetical protein ICV61_20140 [Microcoleus sp. Co-bin12]|nr:hypothetical protein [Microcoleus sp. Co-bin12]